MKSLAKSFLSALFLTCLFSVPAFAKGEITVERGSGDTQTYSVEISNTQNILYFKSPDSGTILMITKKECNPEGKLLVCNQARMGIDTQGILEELDVKQIYLFINPTTEHLPIKGSQITMSPGTILLEAITSKGSYITGLGKIDSNTKPAGASK